MKWRSIPRNKKAARAPRLASHSPVVRSPPFFFLPSFLHMHQRTEAARFGFLHNGRTQGRARCTCIGNRREQRRPSVRPSASAVLAKRRSGARSAVQRADAARRTASDDPVPRSAKQRGDGDELRQKVPLQVRIKCIILLEAPDPIINSISHESIGR